MQIFAITKDKKFALLQRGVVKNIGFIIHTKSYDPNKETISLHKTVYFHYGTRHYDTFTFTNNRLTSHAISFHSPSYLSDVYRECADTRDMSLRNFLNKVVDSYTMKELGFEIDKT